MGGGSILIIDDDDDILTAGKLLLKRHYGHIEITNRPQSIPARMAARDFDVILLDMNFGPGRVQRRSRLRMARVHSRARP